MNPSIIALGLIITVGLVLEIVAVFTNAWVIDSASSIDFKLSFGIVPYPAGLPDWFCTISIVMYIALGVSGLAVFAYLFAVWKASRDGCCHSLRHAFAAVSGFCSPVAVLEIFSFFMAIINAPINDGRESQYVGYSAYLAVVSGFIMSLASGMATYIARRQCH